MERLTITIALDLTDKAPFGPGWYTAAWIDNQRVIGPSAIDPSDAYDAARILQSGIEHSDGELPLNPMPDLVRSGTALIRDALEKQLEYAEAQASKITSIRKQLSTLPKEKNGL